ncbi:PX domain containing protein [Nitzschia inconspicua]|uniref:PX domain containing protein n=1 Tax=Nitzschia inconspicua TaxID=303405 RepID=A0A9K3PL28_9STRA|nr:PX domain containing protein [Nitzschia inconspicua]
MTYYSTTTNDLKNSSLDGGNASVLGSSSSSSHLNNFRSNSSHTHRHHHHSSAMTPLVPHRGSLCRIDGNQGGSETVYTLEIHLENEDVGGRASSETHELVFLRKDFEFAMRLFSIMDSESRGQVGKATVQEFVTMRCPVFWRRDEDLLKRDSVYSLSQEKSPTFEEVWNAVAACSVSARPVEANDLATAELGVEGWMVFCRFIALAQYLEAKRRFSGRHLQQTMRHRNSPRGSEMVVVDVPPAVPPVPLTAKELALYEQENQKCLPLPELDLDHSLLAAHDVLSRRRQRINGAEDSLDISGHVKIDLFGPSSGLLSSSATANQNVDFCLTFFRGTISSDRGVESTTVRRSMNDLKWLNDTFISQKSLGGTLCGRILPPFPCNRVLASYQEDSSLGGATGGAMNAAANAGLGIANAGVGIATASVGMLKEGIKSLWGGYSSSSQVSSIQKNERRHRTKGLPSPKNSSHTYYNPNSPAGQARHLERYLNYLLEHPALSTSFPLNTVLKASQAGLDAAKKSLEEHTKAARAIKRQTPNLEDGKNSTFWSLSGSPSLQPNLAWVRTAAQAAVALQLHGVLETTGLQSASARLQHASLPSFETPTTASWVFDDGDQVIQKEPEGSNVEKSEESFEEGVMHVEDGLQQSSQAIASEEDASGYDLLPLPVPAPERQILSVGETNPRSAVAKETRFRYGSFSIDSSHAENRLGEDKRVYLGDMAIDDDIDKLRDIIGYVDNTLSRCLAGGDGIEQSRGECQSLHLRILRDLDSWEGLRGKFVSQRALLKGVSGIEQSREVFEESDLALIEDLSWQAALAHSAVSAAEDVRSSVRAARTAANAKATAAGAARVAQAACDKGKFASIDEARAAQTRASIAQSHAIHAAVVEHEANTAKRRATLALAHDVKCWNVHRKREVLQAALSYAKSQHEATRRAVDAWACLRDGFVGSNIIPSALSIPATKQQKQQQMRMPSKTLDDEVESRIFCLSTNEPANAPQTIVAVDHELLKIPVASSVDSSEKDIFGHSLNSSSHAEPDASLPFVEADLIPDLVMPSPNDSAPVINSNVELSQVSNQDSFVPSKATVAVALEPEEVSETRGREIFDDEAMTSSMQSLVNGLMTWGGEDVEVDFALPAGMAASIAMEESGVFCNKGSRVSYG